MQYSSKIYDISAICAIGNILKSHGNNHPFIDIYKQFSLKEIGFDSILKSTDFVSVCNPNNNKYALVRHCEQTTPHIKSNIDQD